MRLVLLGPPGVGKGTQAEGIARKVAVPHISTGDMFRAAVKQGTPAGRAAKRYMDAGELAPDDVVTDMVRERLGAADCERGFLLDGFPRTRPQAEALDGLLAEANARLDGVVYFTAPRDVIVDRLSGRRLCRKCGAGYHVRYMAPKKAGVCDRCGGELYQRDDDRPEAILERLRVYEAQTAELVEYYRGKGLLHEVAADHSVDEVGAAVAATLRRLGGPRAGSEA